MKNQSTEAPNKSYSVIFLEKDLPRKKPRNNPVRWKGMTRNIHQSSAHLTHTYIHTCMHACIYGCKNINFSLPCKARVHIASLEQYKTWNSPCIVKSKKKYNKKNLSLLKMGREDCRFNSWKLYVEPELHILAHSMHQGHLEDTNGCSLGASLKPLSQQIRSCHRLKDAHPFENWSNS